MGPYYKVVTFFLRILFRLFYHVDVKGEENIPDGKALIAPNHLSYLDPPLLGAVSKDELFGVAKPELFSIPFLGKLIHRMNARPADTNTLFQMKSLIKTLQEGKKVLLFPEGARSLTGHLQIPLKNGAAYLASRTDAPIVPVFIEGAFEAWPPQKKWPKLFCKLSVTFGKPLYWSDYAHFGDKAGRNQMMDDLAKAYLAHLK